MTKLCRKFKLLRPGLWVAGLAGMVLSSCQSIDLRHHMLVSVADQKLVLLDQGKVVGCYPVSTSRYGLGDWRNSYRTPVGRMAVAKKIGDGYPAGAVFENREWNGEVLKPDAPGRDPVVSRILWLRGLEARNRNAYDRMIYIHGTAEERYIGRPASFGCLRMKSKDVIDLFARVRVGTPVTVLPGHLPMAVQVARLTSPQPQPVAVAETVGKTLPAPGTSTAPAAPAAPTSAGSGASSPAAGSTSSPGKT